MVVQIICYNFHLIVQWFDLRILHTVKPLYSNTNNLYAVTKKIMIPIRDSSK